MRDYDLQVAERYRALGSVAAVSREFPGVPKALIQDTVHAFVADPRTHRSTPRSRARKSERNDEIARLRFVEGKTISEIAVTFHLTVERVRQILARYK
jgi:hypothetical protein